ncbi:transglutaminase TgpA family protein [Halomicrococcus sp. NG-SE-24]|uniref:transglutaminase TgpA family protein n=1 Tax=Halomicrococcus sp. NG-SE-24 TaxID=3436928 RepID=UPI003D960F0C
MSTATDGHLDVGETSVPFHWLAVAATAVLIWSYLSVLYRITNVVGGKSDLALLVAGALVAGAVLARKLPAWTAFVVGGGLLVAGLFGYYTTVPGAYLAFSRVGRIVADNVALLTGLSVLQMRGVGTWALGVAPATVFVPWYLVFRRQYGLAAATGGLALGFFVLTGDVGSFATLVGVLGALGVVAFGTMARYGGTVAQLDVLAVAMVLMILLSTTVSLVPGGRASPILPSGGSGGTATGGLVSNDRRVAVQGSIDLSPKVQFVVNADRPSYWRVGAYDRYTGSDWVRTGGNRDYRSRSSPPGEDYRIRQTITVRRDAMKAMPAAWKPVRVVGDDKGNVALSSTGGLVPQRSLGKNESYSVVSRVPATTPRKLRNADTNYPDGLESRYTQLPASTSDRVKRKAAAVTSEAENPYDKAVAVERWLERNKEYSLEVDKPSGSVADDFVFEMEKGYCVYYATSMVVMLRSQGIPARFVTGYTSGQRVSKDEWVVRGVDSHAWVEVYFPDVGWVRFDPTPGGPRVDAEQQRIESAREDGVSGVDTSGSENGTWTPEPTSTTPSSSTTPTPGENGTTSGSVGDPRVDPNQPNDVVDPGTTNTTTATSVTTTSDEGGGIPVSPPSTEQLLYGGLALFGLLVAARRTGTFERAYRAAWMRWQPRKDPEADVERAFERLERYLAGQHRARRPGETPREYLEALSHVGVDDRAHRVGTLYEQARYAGEVSREQADEAVSLVNDLVRGRSRTS